MNLAEQPEYCEKIMYVRRIRLRRITIMGKKEDIICRIGKLAIQLFSDEDSVKLQVNGAYRFPVDRY